MTEEQALAATRAAGRRRTLSMAGFVVLAVIASLAVRFVINGEETTARRAVAFPVGLVFWAPFIWLFVWRPFSASHRRLATLDHMVRGEVVRLRAGFVTAEVGGERPREWRAGRRARRLALGDEVWLSPAGEDDAMVVALCVPRNGSHFVVTDVPGIYTSLR